jgi:hypothetical protein
MIKRLPSFKVQTLVAPRSSRTIKSGIGRNLPQEAPLAFTVCVRTAQC